MTIWHRPVDLAALNRLRAGTLIAHLGIEFTSHGDDWLGARMPVDPRTHQTFGLLHGGASVALAETVSSVGGTIVLDPTVHFVVGLEINANHVRGVRDGFVHAVATAEALGQSTQVWTIRIRDDQDRLVSLARATLAVLQRGPRAAGT